MPVLAVGAAVAAGFLVVRRRRRAAACRTTPALADLDMPTIGPAKDGAPSR
ncbi:hypothetical protein [Streptomyces sp. NPDC055036]